ncbi:hypothetical protein SARC_03047 [Sphaeroforma arctica JP610]|uniref:Plant heme peroxidase family profile domain-containing protein n=1 Tax=Sphaeroforma arctica JP610 TaxID=667725 RepID=A0A0L0G739_9EUKA|nr:hypothetical protein SARC_03047 [Sphaeroforma arctica JP610]KNC84734.1 hypothetical protein SARC_03047 [Sphaeroforma arctica JP610]|eukprot:XP_014158636.1 hypothetical protein SARC_03047 [Sphaeroforma arctica JP610]
MVRISTISLLAAVCAATVAAQQQIFDKQWYSELTSTAQAQYDNLVEEITEFLNGNSEDFRDDDQYPGFGQPSTLPVHSSIKVTVEKNFGPNGCILSATEILEGFASKHKVSFADTLVIASTIGLQEMGFPAMHHIQVTGGRYDVKDDPEEELNSHLPASDVNPIRMFTEQYGCELDGLVALTGGAHSFGASHAKCSGYEGTRSADPLKWDVNGKGFDFFSDMVKDDWQWFWVSRFEDDTITYTPSHDSTFPSDHNVQARNRGEQGITKVTAPEATKTGTNRVARDEEIQVMRDCELPTDAKNMKITDTLCVNGTSRAVIRLPVDFWMLKRKDMRQYALEFAESDEKFAKAFAQAWQKMIDQGTDRCSALGTVCAEIEVCHKQLEYGFYVDGICEATDTNEGECDTDLCPMEWRGDGMCDKLCNTEECRHDSGDCEEHNCSPKCSPSMLGDECDTLPEYMLPKCPNASQYADRYDAHAVKDWSVNCDQLAQSGRCVESHEYMEIVCKAACTEVKEHDKKYSY